jgi:hypothetical protein
MGCGVDWSVPVTHFPGVDEKGVVCFSKQVGQVDLGDGLKLPLIVNFRSDRERVSPFLGKGWILTLLESNIVQKNENDFLMTLPDGWVRKLSRAKPADDILDGGGFWKAELSGSRIVAWAQCGWKLSYENGRLKSIVTPKNRQLDIKYDSGGAVELVENGKTWLSVTPDEHGTAVSYGDKRIGFTNTDRPKVQAVGAVNVVAGIDKTLGEIVGEQGKTVIEYQVDDKIRPTMSIGAVDGVLHNFTWNPATAQVISDGPWKYKSDAMENGSDYAPIGRSNQAGQSEFWYYDINRGLETVQDLSGKRRITSWFVGGILHGKTRKVEEVVNGVTTVIARRQYDEKGVLIRKDDQTGEVSYNPKSWPVKVTTKEGAELSLSYQQ